MPIAGRVRPRGARLCPALIALLFSLIAVSSAHAGNSGADGASLIAMDLRDGKIDAVTALIQMFRWAFEPQLCLPEYQEAERGTIRCLQPHISRYHSLRGQLTSETIKEIDGYLQRGYVTKSGLSYVSPLGIFELHYETTGPDSVSSEDISPANGIPDFVERCGEYADHSWVTEVGLGFAAPLLPPDGTYDIGFQDLGVGFYGFADTSGTTTTIVLHSTFQGGGWPNNTDPDGEPLGRAKATIAHELKHASQHTNNGWTEGLWAELDAAWVEDIVYPATNDYLNFLDNWSYSQLDSPWTPLDNDGGEGNYEDCLWEHYLSLTHGTQIIADLWDIRAASPGDMMTEAFHDVLELYSTDWDESYAKYLEYCWFTGTRARPPFGFPDAPALWKMEFVDPANGVYPYSVLDTVDAIAGHPRRFNRGLATGAPRIVFDGEDDTSRLTVSVILVEPTGTISLVRPAMEAGNTFDYLAPIEFQSLLYLGVIVTNSDLSGEELDYSLQVLDDDTTDVPTLQTARELQVRLEAPFPNPATTLTRFSWSLPHPDLVTLRILDVSGRVIRTLQDREPSRMRGETTWDGTAEGGLPAPAGVYWAVLDCAKGTSARRTVRLR